MRQSPAPNIGPFNEPTGGRREGDINLFTTDTQGFSSYMTLKMPSFIQKRLLLREEIDGSLTFRNCNIF